MNSLSFSIFMQMKLMAGRKRAAVGIFDDEWTWANRGRYYSLRTAREHDKRIELEVITHAELFERVMPESETSYEPVLYRSLCMGNLTDMEKEEVTRWLYKGMLKAILK